MGAHCGFGIVRTGDRYPWALLDRCSSTSRCLQVRFGVSVRSVCSSQSLCRASSCQFSYVRFIFAFNLSAAAPHRVLKSLFSILESMILVILCAILRVVRMCLQGIPWGALRLLFECDKGPMPCIVAALGPLGCSWAFPSESPSPPQISLFYLRLYSKTFVLP